MAKREFHQGMTSMDTQLLADVIPVSLDGAWTDEKLLRDLLAGLVLGNR